MMTGETNVWFAGVDWCAVYNGTLGSGFGQKFRNANAPYLPIAIAA
jgi:hypothetical protein